jgi:hypothetical protein
MAGTDGVAAAAVAATTGGSELLEKVRTSQDFSLLLK